MRVAQRQKSNRGPVAGTSATPAPVRGWNARDAINLMKPEYAYRLVNWWPMASYLQVRDGSADHATGLPAQVESLLVYRPENGSEKLFAVSGNAFYDATSPAAVGAPMVSSLGSNRWESVNFSTTGGNFLVCVNGVDDLRLYNGTTWTAINGASTPAITGVSTAALIKVASFKERLFFVEKDSLKVWYLPVKSIAGAASLLDLRSVFRRGGSLVAIASWSLDSGAGPDDYLLLITDQGEVAAYKGTDPSNSATWSIIGRYTIAPPLGPVLDWGGDVLIATKEGVIPASKALIDGQTKPGIALSDQILSAWSEAAQLWGGNFGWQLVHYPHASMLLCNVPVNPGRQVQYCMNSQTGAWTQFEGWSANCWATFKGDLYFGGNQVVRHAWTGSNDAGAAVQADAVTAFSPFGDPVSIKQWRLGRPTLSVTGAVEDVRMGLCTDFRLSTPEGAVQIAGTAGAIWDTSLWDQAVWGGSPEAQNGWYALEGVGYYGALALRVRTKTARVTWSATAYLFETGGVI